MYNYKWGRPNPNNLSVSNWGGLGIETQNWDISNISPIFSPWCLSVFDERIYSEGYKTLAMRILCYILPEWDVHEYIMTAFVSCCLPHWGRVRHICVSKLTSIGSDNGLSPSRRQAIIWTNAWILLIGPLWTNFSEILFEILTFSLMKIRLKVSSAKWRPSCLGLNVLTQ